MHVGSEKFGSETGNAIAKSVAVRLCVKCTEIQGQSIVRGASYTHRAPVSSFVFTQRYAREHQRDTEEEIERKREGAQL